MKEINDLTISISKEHIHCCPDQVKNTVPLFIVSSHH